MPGAVSAIASNPDSGTLSVGGSINGPPRPFLDERGWVQLIDADTMRPRGFRKLADEPVNRAAFSGDGKTLAAGTDHTVLLSDARDLRTDSRGLQRSEPDVEGGVALN